MHTASKNKAYNKDLERYNCSRQLFARGVKVTPGGVNSPVRAFKQVSGEPIFIAKGEGAYIYDVDDSRYIDYVGSWGPLILGHRAPVVNQAISSALEHGTSFGAPTELEVEFAELLVSVIPSIEMLRFVSSGTEATMSAIRLARAYTGRDIIIKFDGCYHGHSDCLLVKAGSGVATLGIPSCAGIPTAVANATVSIAFNDLDLFRDTVQKLGADRIAGVIIEPVAGNMGLIKPLAGFLEGLREIAHESGIVLIFDEVMSGFRVGLTGAQGYYGITPDLTTLGKVIGGGLPVGAFGGRREIMELLAPVGSVYQAGTLSGNPLAMAAGLATIREILARNPYEVLAERAKQLCEGFVRAGSAHGIDLTADFCGSMFGFFFSAENIQNFEQAQNTRIDLFKDFFWEMLTRGVYLAPSALEAGFLGTCHSEQDIEKTLKSAFDSLQAMASKHSPHQ